MVDTSAPKHKSIKQMDTRIRPTPLAPSTQSSNVSKNALNYNITKKTAALAVPKRINKREPVNSIDTASLKGRRKFKISARLRRLSTPKNLNRGPDRDQSSAIHSTVHPKALNYMPSQRIMELAVPKHTTGKYIG